MAPFVAFFCFFIFLNILKKNDFYTFRIGSKWNWDFGDGSNSTEQSPVHIYTAAGTYTVNLTVSNENGTASKLGTIMVIRRSLSTHAYIANYLSNNVSVIDTATNTVVSSVEFGLDQYGRPLGKSPFGVAVTPDGTKVYITNLSTNPKIFDGVSVIDTATNTIVASIPNVSIPWGIAINRQGTKVFVGGHISDSIFVIDTATNTVTGKVPVGTNPWGIAVTPDGTKVYVANGGSNTVSVIDTATNKVVDTVTVGNYPRGIAVTPDGTKVYVANSVSMTVSVIDTATNKVTATLQTDKNYFQPYGVAISPDGKIVYITGGTEIINAFDVSSNKLTRFSLNGIAASGIAFNPDGTRVYITDGGNRVYVIDTVTHNILDSIGVGSEPVGFGQFMAPNTNQELVADFSTNISLGYAPITVTFADRSEGLPTAWHWDFGDGNTSTEQSPKHTYNAAGNYTVNLTVSNSKGTSTKLATINVLATVLPVANFNSNVTIGYAPLTVNFTDLSVNATSLDWDFGDGNISNETNPVHTYYTAGVYTVNLTASNGNGTSLKNATATITVLATVLPVANFSSNVTSGYAPFTVQFNDSSVNADTVSWDFGDGNTSIERNPLYTYSAVGMYMVKLTAANGNGTNSTFSRILVLSKSNILAATFYASPTSGNVPLNVNFYDSSTGSPSSWRWTFGDGTNSTQQNPVHVYSKPGLYTVVLTVSKAGNSSSVTKSSYVAVSNDTNIPVTAFSASTTSGTAPLFVYFTDSSAGSPTSWKWTFGDGTNSNEQNPVHEYNKVGLYTVTLTATNAKGSNTMTKSGYIAISTGVDAPVAAFYAYPTFGSAPLSVSFTDSSTGFPTSWKWTFGDGTNSTEQSPVHVYSKAGVYTVSLTTSNAGGSNVLTKTSFIAVSNSSSALSVAFSATPTSGSSPLSVNFTDQSTGPPISWKWTFGDGASSTEQNPVYVYNKAGVYTVSLTASNAGGSNKATKSSLIAVSNGVTAPVAAFSATPTSGSAPLSVNFTDSSTGSPTSWKWLFGDGTNSTEQNPVHVYGKTGRYTISLTVNNPGGSSVETTSGYIAVK